MNTVEEEINSKGKVPDIVINKTHFRKASGKNVKTTLTIDRF